MSTSKHTFDQVKSILGKLDRSIDDARARRLDSDRPVPVGGGGSGGAAPAVAPVAPSRPDLSQARPVQARPLRATPNYGSGGPSFNGRADHKAP